MKDPTMRLVGGFIVFVLYKKNLVKKCKQNSTNVIILLKFFQFFIRKWQNEK